MDTVILLGGTSDIAFSIAELELQRKARVILVARDRLEIEIRANDLRFRYGNSVHVDIFVLDDSQDYSAWNTHLLTLSRIDRCYCLIGSYSAKSSLESTLGDIRQNVEIPLKLIWPVIQSMKANNRGSVLVATSVAQLIPRSSIIGYGAGKSALSFILQCWSREYGVSNVNFVEARLGWVDTRMSKGKSISFFTKSPDFVSKKLFKSISKSGRVIYVPKFWLILRLLAPAINCWTGIRVRRFGKSQRKTQ